MSGKKKKIDVNTLLISAVSKGNLRTVKELVRSYSLSHCEEWCGGFVLLCNAIKSAHIEITKFLLQEGAKVNCDTDRVGTPLHFAAELKWVGVELVCLLLEKNALVDAQNSRNETPLHLAAKGGYSETVEVLLNNNASVAAQTNEGFTPLYFAIEGRHKEVAQMLLKHAYANVKSSRKKRDSVLLNCILLSNPSIRDKVNELVVRIVTDDNDHSKIVDDLAGYGFILGREYVSESLLLAATRKNHPKLIESILSSGTNSIDVKHSALLLHIAVKNGCEEIVKLFLDAGFDANAKDEEGKTSICYSLNCSEEGKCAKILRLLFASGVDIKEASELLHTAANKGFAEVCKVLIDNGADVNALKAEGSSPLHLVFPKKGSGKHHGKHKDEGTIKEAIRDEIIKLLLTSGADASIKAADGFTAFHYAIKTGRRETVCLFVDHGVCVDLRAEDNSTPLHLAAHEGHKIIVKILCSNNANVNACRKNGATPLYLAAENAHTEIMEILCRYRANVNARQENGWTPLHRAAWRGHKKTVKMLCMKRADINACQENGWTPLHIAASNQNEDAIETLLDFGANIDAQGADGVTALHWAASGPNYGCRAAEVLLEHGADVNVKTKDGNTPLATAVLKNEEVFRQEHPYESDNSHEDSDDEDFCNQDDIFIPDRCEMIQTLKKHLMKLKVAGFYLNQENLYLLGQSFSYIDDFKEICEEEISRLKRMKSNRKFSLYDVLVNSEKLSYANKMSMLRFLKSSVLMWQFPIYESLILSNLKKSASRYQLIAPAQKALDALIKTSSEQNGNKCLALPAELLERTLSYLNNGDLKNLICCAKALKN